MIFELRSGPAIKILTAVSSPTSFNPSGGDELRRAQQGDPRALAAFREELQSQLFGILRARGASQTETEDILADLWSDCVPGDDGRPSLLRKFGGRFSLLSWLARVACNRWIDQKRRGAKQVVLEDTDVETMPGCPIRLEEDALQAILQESLRSAFERCPGRELLLLRLVYLHGLSQREAGHLVGWSESKTSRLLSHALDQLKTRTLLELKRRDERLELSWEDLLGLCASSEDPLL